MTRRLLLLGLPAAALVAADPAQQAYDLVSDAASALSAGDAETFLALFDRSMPHYEDFVTQVHALLEQSEVESSVVVLRNEGDAAARALELDWFVQLKSRNPVEAITRRREIVKCTVRKSGRKWRFFSFVPFSLLAPVKIR